MNRLSIVLIISIVAVAFASGCIGQSQPQALFNLTKDGVLYEFNNNIYDSLNVPISDKNRIYEKLVMPDQLWLLYTKGADEAIVAVAAADITAKVQYYNTYSLGKIVRVGTYDLSGQSEQNVSASDLTGTLIELRGPAMVNETAVFMSGERIIVEGTNRTQLSMAADRLTLVLFEDELRIAGISIPASASPTAQVATSASADAAGFDYENYNPPAAEINYSLLFKWPIVKSPIQYYIYNNTEINPYAYNTTLATVQLAFEHWENATGGKVRFEQVYMPGDGIAIEIVPSLRADVIGEASATRVREYPNYTLIVGGNMTVAPQYGFYEIILVHEIGHLMGLGHSKNPHSVLYPDAEPSQEITPDILEALDILYQDIPATS